MSKVDKQNAQAIYILQGNFRWLQRLGDWPHPITDAEYELIDLLDDAVLNERPQEEVEFLTNALMDQRERDFVEYRSREKGNDSE